MTNAHTPGPWYVDSCDDDLVFSTNGLHIATVGNAEQEQPFAEITANARLIAAAPELHEALEFFFNIMHDYESSRRKGYISIAFDQARAALAKAKGGAPDDRVKENTVIIEVLGGVAHVSECPRGVTVKIIDHDTASSGGAS
jgi:hypothetical protein